ncbi:MAG: hypothetical protein QOG05_1412 [Streptosporangiaceae bacterium]|nr:hypothetical protein [Streptosporangiaceae bacterium]
MRAGLAAGACLVAAVALLDTGCSSGGGAAAGSPSSETRINDLNAALGTLGPLGTSLSRLGSQPSATAAAAAVPTGLAGVTSSASDLLRAASVRCPSASASPSA